MYSTVNRDPLVAAPPKAFPFLSLPCELRLHVLSFITLPPHKESEELKPKKQTPEDDHYYEQRKICHETSKSLLLVSKAVKYEAEQLFYQHKTLVLSKPTPLLSMQQHMDYILSSARSMNLSKFRHIEFDIRHSQEDTDQHFVQLCQKFVLMNGFLRKNIKKYPQLQTVTCKLVDYITDSDSPTPTPETDLNFGVLSPRTKRPMVITSWQSDSEGSESTYDKSDVEEILEEMQVFYQYADGLAFDILPSDQWRWRKAMFKSEAKAQHAFFIHELKFERSRPAVNETPDVEEDTRSMCSELLGMVGGHWDSDRNDDVEDKVEKWLDNVMVIE